MPEEKDSRWWRSAGPQRDQRASQKTQKYKVTQESTAKSAFQTVRERISHTWSEKTKEPSEKLASIHILYLNQNKFKTNKNLAGDKGNMKTVNENKNDFNNNVRGKVLSTV